MMLLSATIAHTFAFLLQWFYVLPTCVKLMLLAYQCQQEPERTMFQKKHFKPPSDIDTWSFRQNLQVKDEHCMLQRWTLHLKSQQCKILQFCLPDCRFLALRCKPVELTYVHTLLRAACIRATVGAWILWLGRQKWHVVFQRRRKGYYPSPNTRLQAKSSPNPIQQ